MGVSGCRHARRGQALVEVAMIVPICLLLVLGAYDTSVMGSDKVIATTAARNGVRLGSELGGWGNTGSPVGTFPNTCSGAAPSTLSLAQADQEIIATVLASTGNMTYIGGGTTHEGLPDEIDIYRPGSPDGRLDKGSDRYESYSPEAWVLALPFLSSGSSYTTLTVSATTAPLASGVPVTLTKGVNRQTVNTSAAVPIGSTGIPVVSFTANAGYDNTTVVSAPTAAFITNHNGGSNFTMDIRCQGPLGNEAEIGVRIAWTYKPANGIPGPKFVFDDGAGAGHLPADWAVEKVMLCVENCVIK